MSLKKLVVKQDENNLVEAEVLAGAIIDIAVAMKKINSSRLSRNAICALVKDATGISKSTTNRVLDSVSDLERTYCK